MEELLRKKINLLVHLARIDGKMDHSEQEMLRQILKDHRIEEFDWNSATPSNVNDFKNAPSKAEVLYLALRMVHADGILHPDEVAYCKALAVKLNYKTEVVDFFSSNELGSISDFKKRISTFALASA